MHGQNLLYGQSSSIGTILLRVALTASPVMVSEGSILPAFAFPKVRVPAFSGIRLRIPKGDVSSQSIPKQSAFVLDSHPSKIVWLPNAEETIVHPQGHLLHPLVVQLDRSIGLMEQQLARLGLRQEWIPLNSSFFYALGQQMMRKHLLPRNMSLSEFVAYQVQNSAEFLKEHETELKSEGIYPSGELQGQMLASACLHSVTVVHWAAATEGLVETVYSPPQEMVSRCRIYVCSVGPILWSTMPFGPGEVKISIQGTDGLISESRISDEIAQRLLRAQTLSTAVRWVSAHRALHTPRLEKAANNKRHTMEPDGRAVDRIEKTISDKGLPRDTITASKGLSQARNVGTVEAPPRLVSTDVTVMQPAVMQPRSRTKSSKSNKKGNADTNPMDSAGTGGNGDLNSVAQQGSSSLTYYLIDMSGLIFRSFHAMPRMARQDGVANNALFGVCRTMQKMLLQMPKGSVIVPVFDKGSHTFRNDLYPEYKAHRPPLPEDLRPQFKLIREATVAFGLKVMEMEGFEADDIIATMATQAAATGATVRIVSSDKDLCQLVNERVTLWDPTKDTHIGEAEVLTKFGVAPARVADVQALIGDASDNVPGVRGIGPKNAAALINEFGNFEELLKAQDSIKQARLRQALKESEHLALLSYQLVRLRTDLDLPPFSSFIYQGPDSAALRALYEEHGFKTLLADLDRVPAPRARAPLSQPPAVSLDRVAAVSLELVSPEAGAHAANMNANNVAQVKRNERGAKASAAAKQILEAAAAAAEEEGMEEERGDVLLAKAEYSLIESVEALRPWAEAAERHGRVSIMAMASSSNAHTAQLVGLALSVEPGRACYVPLRTLSEPGPEPGVETQGLSVEEVMGVIGKVLSSPSVVKIGHDVKYLVTLMGRYAPHLTLAPVDDTMLLSFVLDAGKHRHGAAELATEQLGLELLTLKDAAQRAANKNLRSQPVLTNMAPVVVCDVAAQAADVTLRIHEQLAERLTRERLNTIYYHMERPLVAVLARMEQRGVHLDTGNLSRLSADFATRMVSLEHDIYKEAGREFAIGSPKQLAQVLFEELRLPLGDGKKGKSGGLSTDSEVLEELAGKGFKIAEKVNEWRQVSKLKSTFTDALQAQINPRTGRVHTTYCMAAAATGRLSSVDPNLQNIPTVGLGKPIRQTFTAPEGYSLLSADYSQIELRLLAHMAHIDALQDAFRNGVDVHALTASQVFGVPLDKMTPDVRRRAKAINFGIIYGQSAFGLSKGLDISVQEAKKYIETYFQRYPGIQAYMERTRAAARDKGYVETLFGRRCHIVNMAKTGALRSYADRQAINAPIQGTAADIIKRAMIRMEPALAAAGLEARMLLQVHDELVFEVPCGQEAATAKVVKEVMEGAAAPTHELSVPLIVDTGIGHSWGDAH